MMQRADYNGFPLGGLQQHARQWHRLPGAIGPVRTAARRCGRPILPRRAFSTFRRAVRIWWNLYSLTAHWKTGLGEFVSSTAYFDRRVDEHEDQSEFVWAAITSGACDNPAPYCNPPAPGPIEEIKAYQRFVEEVRFVSKLPGPVQFVIGGFYSDFHGRVPFASLYPPSQVPNLDNEAAAAPNNPDLSQPDLCPGLPHRHQGAGACSARCPTRSPRRSK